MVFAHSIIKLTGKTKVDFLNEISGELLRAHELGDIPGFDDFVKIQPLNKGLSGDNKLYIETKNGQRLLLRVAKIEEYERKKMEYDMLKRAANLSIPISTPKDFGICNNGKNVYQLLEWVVGEDLEEVMINLSETEQYVCGLKAGRLLQKINTLPAPEDAEPWADRFWLKVLRRIEFCETHNLKSENSDSIIRFLRENKRIIEDRPQTFIHGDFNISNLILMPSGEMGAVDFSCYNKDYGDPWWDIFTFIWGTEVPGYFYTGLINGYFNNEPTTEFFKVLSYYLAYDALAALCDTSIGEQGEPQDGQRHMANVLLWLDNMNSSVPTWYFKDFCVQWADGVPYKLNAPYDFSFLSRYGKVFKVFDEQGSGNIAFGTEKGGKRYFVKFAGAPKPNYIANRESGEVDAESAVTLLKAAVPIYRDLAHPTLIKFVTAEEIPCGATSGGFAAVFEYEDAIGIEPKDSPDYLRFMQMPLENKKRAFEDIVEFHIHVAEKGYVALDFYDGSILYDYDNEKVIICDIDLYQKSPFVNVGKMGIIGSAGYVSPEECIEDEVMDEITNVYTMGATAFALFAYGNRTLEKWTLSKEQHDVAIKAVSDERDNRQQGIKQFLAEWRSAKC
jgi:serine/threonine-protein kinase